MRMRVKNPAGSLMLINPKGSGKMATRRRRTTNRRRPAAAANPRRRRRNSTNIYAAAPRRRNSRRVARNPRRRRARNPSVKNLVVGSFFAALGAMAQKAIAGFIPLRAEGILGLGIELGVAWLTATIGERFLGGPNAQAFALGAAGGFGASALNYVLGFATSGVGALTSAAQPKALPAPQGGVNDIVAWDGRGGVGDVIAYPYSYH
jgi:hypothetical protein